MARELLIVRGHPVTGLSPAAIITRALHTTSDFGLIVGDTIGRTLRAAYQAAPVGIRRLGRQTTARDFRTVNKIMLGEAPMLEKLNEHGEIKAGTMAEAGGLQGRDLRPQDRRHPPGAGQRRPRRLRRSVPPHGPSGG